jgi:hypothetical protein
MAGTRYILANYLRILGLEENFIRRSIVYLTNYPGYPSKESIIEAFSKLGVQICEQHINVSELASLSKMAISSFDSGSPQYILVLHVLSDSIVYLNNQEEIFSEPIEKFDLRWSKRLLHISPADLGVMRAKLSAWVSEQSNSSFVRPKISDIKKAQLTSEPIVYKICRLISKYLSYVFIRLGIHPNVITFLWILPIVASSYIYSFGLTVGARMSTFALIFLGYTLDCSDGEVARITGKKSKLGGYLDTINHWLSGPLLIWGISLGQFKDSHNSFYLANGMLCILFSTFYNYLSNQLNYWRNTNNPYGSFHSLLYPLFWLSPIDSNLFLLGDIFNCLPVCVMVWQYFSLLLTGIMLAIFIAQELSLKN